MRACGLHLAQLDGCVCTIVGYMIISAGVFGVHLAARALRLAKLHRFTGTCYLVLKVVLLITAEAVVFPTLCGWWLDACSLTLFSATLSQRRQGFHHSPATSMFVHWLHGMLYVFYFASFVLVMRDVLRPGTLWFLRNLNDPDFNPIQEVVLGTKKRHI